MWAVEVPREGDARRKGEKAPAVRPSRGSIVVVGVGMLHGPSYEWMNEFYLKPAHAVPLASAHQRPENQKANQAGHSPERAVAGQGVGRSLLGRLVLHSAAE